MIIGLYSTVYLVLACILMLLVGIGVLLREDNLVRFGIVVITLLMVWPLFAVIILLYLIIRIRNSF